MSYKSKFTGAEVDELLQKVKDGSVGSVTIDTDLSEESTNPVENRVITGELAKKVNKSDLATINGQSITEGGNIVIEGGASTEVDSNLSATSENPVQNKVVTASLANKLESDIVASTEPTDDFEFGYDDTEIRQEIADLSAEVGKKQDTITDLETIRSGAAKGATALQSVPATYATKADVSNAIQTAITNELNSDF